MPLPPEVTATYWLDQRRSRRLIVVPAKRERSELFGAAFTFRLSG